MKKALCAICGRKFSEFVLNECARCQRLVCDDCCATEYNNFSYYDGNVDIEEVCAECQGWISPALVGKEQAQ